MELKCKCPNCNRQLGGHIPISGAENKPRPGAIMICAHCAVICVFNADLSLRPIEQGEWLRIKAENEETAEQLVKLKHTVLKKIIAETLNGPQEWLK